MSSTQSELPAVVRTVRSTLHDTIRDAFEADHPVVVEALPASGKSRGVVEWASQTGNQLTILTGRHDVRDQYEEWAEEFGVSFGHVPSQRRDCPLGVKYSGDVEVPADGTDWEKKFDTLLAQYGSAFQVHKNHDGLPCQTDGDCPYVERYRGFDASDYDVIAGHYLHVYSSYPEFPFPEGRYIEDRYIAFDEFPEEDIINTIEGYEDVVTGLLGRIPELPYDTFDEIEVASHAGFDSDEQSLIDAWIAKNGGSLFDPGLSGPTDRDDPNAPALLWAALSREPLKNGWWRADLGSSARVAMNGGNAHILRQPPTETLARGVVALDGTPSIGLWRILLGEDTELASIHGNDEGRRKYLRDGLGIRFIQTSESTKPYGKADSLTRQRPEGSSDYIDDDRVARKDMLAFRWIAQQETDAGPLGFISTKGAIKVYEDYGLDEFVDVRGHYGDLKGSNEFSDIRIGIVAGCNEPSHPRIQMWGAFAGLSLKPEKGENGTILRGSRKTFGEDGDPILVALRENQVLQVAMRFAREPNRNQQPAHVYLHTAAIPEWVEPEQMILHPRLWEQSKGMGQVLTVIREDLAEGSWKSSDVFEAVERRYGEDKKTNRRLRGCLQELRESNTVPYTRPGGEGSGSGGAYIYQKPDVFDGRMLVYRDGYVHGPNSVISDQPGTR